MYQRRHQRLYDDAVMVNDWDSFRKSWKGTEFLKSLNIDDEKERERIVVEKLGELKTDKTKGCYLFPSSLTPSNNTLITKIVESKQFVQWFDYENESLFMGKEKQLLVFKRIPSLVCYLKKYRLPTSYKQPYQNLINCYDQNQNLIIKRNLSISSQDPEITELTGKITQQSKKLTKLVEKYFKILRSIFEDFLSQNKKESIHFSCIPDQLIGRIRDLCDQFKVYFCYKFIGTFQFDEYKDIVINKHQAQEEETTYQSEVPESSVITNIPKTDQPKEIPPRPILDIVQRKITKQGLVFELQLQNEKKMPQQVEITLVHPQITPEQISFKQIHQVKEEFITTLLKPLSPGYCIYRFRTKRSQVYSKERLLKVFFDCPKQEKNEEGTYELNSKNYLIYQLGQSQQGVIPGSTYSDEPIASTQEQWRQCELIKGKQVSVSSSMGVCNYEGDVACWGSMYVFDDEPREQNKEMLTTLQLQKMHIEKPFLALSGKGIRKVSCGEGYCLMSDCLGKVWAFGVNGQGQLGLQHLNEHIDTTEPIIVPRFQSDKVFITDVIASYFGASFAITQEGRAYRWGTNQIESTHEPVKDSYNNIINFQYQHFIYKCHTPLQMTHRMITQPIKHIHPGVEFVLAETTDNKLFGWGKCEYLGISVHDCHFKDIMNVCNPIPVMEGVERVSVGTKHCLVLTQKGELYGWGEGSYFCKQNTLVKEPKQIDCSFRGRFYAGPEYTIIHRESQDQIEVIGDRKTFKAGNYKLPYELVQKLVAGPGVITALMKEKL